jgi:hypothetical protein
MPLPPETSFDDVLIKIKKAYSNPHVGAITQVVLKEGARTFRVATLLEVIKPADGSLHHYSLKLDSIDRKKAGWFSKPERSIRLDGKDPDEIEKLYSFLHALYQGQIGREPGSLHLIKGEDYAKLERLLELLPNVADTDKLQLLKRVLSQLTASKASVADFARVFEGSADQTLRSIAAASRMIEYGKALDALKALIGTASTSEKDFQKHLAANPWMFGSEYSELLPRRSWTRDEKLDFMLRRTVDNYLEIVEIKTAFAEPLFVYDKSHDCYSPSAKLSQIIGQVMHYVAEVERQRDSIRAHDNEDTLKIRALAIAGRDGNAEHQAALRNFNAHLHGIEVITFDQLVRIANRVLSIFAANAAPATAPAAATATDDDDIPF